MVTSGYRLPTKGSVDIRKFLLIRAEYDNFFAGFVDSHPARTIYYILYEDSEEPWERWWSHDKRTCGEVHTGLFTFVEQD